MFRIRGQTGFQRSAWHGICGAIFVYPIRKIKLYSRHSTSDRLNLTALGLTPLIRTARTNFIEKARLGHEGTRSLTDQKPAERLQMAMDRMHRSQGQAIGGDERT